MSKLSVDEQFFHGLYSLNLNKLCLMYVFSLLMITQSVQELNTWTRVVLSVRRLHVEHLHL